MKVINKNEFKNLVIENEGLKLVDFYADWCGPCRMLGPVLEDLSQDINDVEFFKINVDNDGELAQAYQVSSIPTLILFKDGKLVDKKIGFLPKDALVEWIKTNK